MTTVVITLEDKDNMKVQADLHFDPPLENELTNAQAMALRILNLMGGRRLVADRQRVVAEHYLLPGRRQSVRVS